jgi:DnaK suppressor protein
MAAPRDDYWSDRLESVLAGLHEDLQSLESELAATRAIRANGSDDDEHDPDGVPLSSVLQLLEGQRMRTLDQAREAEIALVDLGQGRFGICRKCSQRIPPSRLEIKPTTRTCVKCAT